MPTQISPTDKQNFINIVRAAPYPGGPTEADRLQDVLNNYEDVTTAIYRQLELFASNNAYLKQALATLVDADLVAVGIFNNKSVTSPPLTNPVLIVNSTFSNIDLTITSPPIYLSLALLGNTTIGKLTIAAGVTLGELYIGPNSTIEVLDSSAQAGSPPVSARVNKIYLPYLKSTPSYLNKVAYESQIGQVIVDPGSYYGGIEGNDPNVVCADYVTALGATQITHDSLYLSWTPPASYLFIDIFYKKTGSNTWILANEVNGDFNNNSGFTFRGLDKDTFYSFRIRTVCNNGGFADVVISAQTNCCGNGNAMQLYGECEIDVTIKDSPDPSVMITLCNGQQIAGEYPSGTTLTIPYLVGNYVKRLIVVDNANYQNFPYTPATGEFNAATTLLLTFVDGNKVTINATLPMI